jgi:hypothetical protein
MAYRRKNRLLFMREVIKVYLEYKSEGVSTAWVYRNVIYPRYFISLSTLYNYLSTPVERLIKDNCSEVRQLTMFNPENNMEK